MVYRVGGSFQAADLESVQRAVNYSTLGPPCVTIRWGRWGSSSSSASLVGWFVAGRLLRPVGAPNRESPVGQAIFRSGSMQANPKDELRTLADTIDGMLDRLDEAFRTERGSGRGCLERTPQPVAVVQANVEAVLADDRATPGPGPRCW